MIDVHRSTEFAAHRLSERTDGFPSAHSWAYVASLISAQVKVFTS